MIVVIAFMQGFQQKFRKDIINAQGHARVIPLKPFAEWSEIPVRLRQVEQRRGTPFTFADPASAPKRGLSRNPLHGLATRRRGGSSSHR